MQPQDKRFFEKPDIWTNIQTYFREKEIQTIDSLDSTLKVQTRDSFWFYSQMGYTWSWYDKNVAKTNIDRKRRYEEYQLMDQDAEISAAINIYADESTTISMSTGHVINIDSENDKVKKEIEDLFYKTLQLEDQVWCVARDVCKFGDAPFEIVLNSEETAISRLIPIPIDGFERIEEDRVLKYFQYKPAELLSDGISTMTSSDNAETNLLIKYKPFEVAHFTLRTNDIRYSPYGMSAVEPARKIWKQLKILEDCLIINRLIRSQERKVFYVDVGNMDPASAHNYIQEVKREFFKKPFYNSSTGELDMQSSPVNQMQDFFIPIRAGASNSRIDSLAPSSNLTTIDDINLFRDKMLAALGIPPAYLGRVSGTNATGNSTTTITGLSQQDKKFGRKIQRIQKAIASTLYKIAYIQLFLKGFSAQEFDELKIWLTYPSDLDQIIQLDNYKAKFETATAAKGVPSSNGGQLFSDYWIYKNVMNFNDDEIEEIIKQRIDETPAAGVPGEGAAAGGGAAPSGGGIGEEFQDFAGEAGVPGEEETPEEAGAAETPEEMGAGTPAAKKPAPEVASRQYDKNKIILDNLSRMLKSVQNKRKNVLDTKYISNGNFKHALIEGELKGLAELASVTCKNTINEISTAKPKRGK